MTTTSQTIATLHTLRLHSSGGVITDDRGNGSGGPGYIQETDEIDDNLPIREVAEDEDPEAWERAGVACRSALGDDSTPTRVWVGERAAGSNGHQMIYAI